MLRYPGTASAKRSPTRKKARRWPPAGHCNAKACTKSIRQSRFTAASCTPTHSCGRPSRSPRGPRRPHCVADADGSHVSAHLNHHATYLVAWHKRQLRTVLVESLEKKVGAAKRIAHTQRASRAEVQAHSDTPCLSAAMQPYVTHTAASEQRSIATRTCICKASAKLSAAALTRIRTPFAGRDGDGCG